MPNFGQDKAHSRKMTNGGQQASEPTQSARRRSSGGSSFAARFGRVILQDGIATIPSALLHYQAHSPSRPSKSGSFPIYWPINGTKISPTPA